MYPFCKNNGMKLKELRKQQHKTQKEMAEILGVHFETYKLYEQGRRMPNIETLCKIADYFNISIDYLVGRELDRFIDTSTLSNVQIVLLNKIKKMSKAEYENLLLYLETKD